MERAVFVERTAFVLCGAGRLWQALFMTANLRALSLLTLLILCSLAIEARAIYIIGPYGMVGYYEDQDPPPPPRPRIKCEDVLKLDFSHVPFHKDLERVRNRLGDDLELRNYRFSENEDKLVGVHLVFFGGRSEDVYFRYDSKKGKLLPEAEVEEELQALATSMVIPVLFPNEHEVLIEVRKPTRDMHAAMKRLNYVLSLDSKADDETMIFKHEFSVLSR